MRMAAASPRSARVRRAFLVGFVIGFALPTPAFILYMLVPAAEPWAPWLAPGNELLRPLSPYTSMWHGGLNWLLSSVVNGLVIGGTAACIGLVISRLRRQRGLARH